ncbi:MAG TPA: glycosyltransferase, partial [Thermomicrobiales bacterium]|nr:glycosyltransferase [Thermomicrobiales bacterium]
GLILHVPKLLLSRRTVLTPEPPELDAAAVAAQRAALESAIARRGIDATVEAGISPGRWRVRYGLAATPGVTIVMPSGGKMQYLRPCLDDLIDRTTYPNLHILVLDNSDSFEVAALCDELALRFPRLRREPVELTPFNFSALINRALPFVETPYVILLNDDITVVTPDWVEAMLEHAQRPEVGIVGPKLLYPDGTLQHVGVVLGPFDGTVHAFKQFPGDTKGWFGLPNVIRNYSAVTFACAMMRTSLFQEVGGLDEENLPIAFNDVDFCLRVIEAGYRVVYTPHAVLYHHESVTKKAITNPSEVARLRSRWGHVIAHDPYYSPNLTRLGEDCSLNFG